MKKILLLFLMFITICLYSQVDYNIYIDKSKKEIIQILKEDGLKSNFQDKLYVEIDSTGKWSNSEDFYTYLAYYSDIKALFTFNIKTNRCVKYYLLCQNLENYWEYFDYYNQIFIKDSFHDLTWTEKRHKYFIEINLKALNVKQFQIFVKSKTYKK